jgi:hypothetical protein
MEQQSRDLQRIKVDLLECYIAETQFATFLMDCFEKYGSGLPVDEMFKGSGSQTGFTAWFRKSRLNKTNHPISYQCTSRGGTHHPKHARAKDNAQNCTSLHTR